MPETTEAAYHTRLRPMSAGFTVQALTAWPKGDTGMLPRVAYLAVRCEECQVMWNIDGFTSSKADEHMSRCKDWS